MINFVIVSKKVKKVVEQKIKNIKKNKKMYNIND